MYAHMLKFFVKFSMSLRVRGSVEPRGGTHASARQWRQALGKVRSG